MLKVARSTTIIKDGVTAERLDEPAVLLTKKDFTELTAKICSTDYIRNEGIKAGINFTLTERTVMAVTGLALFEMLLHELFPKE